MPEPDLADAEMDDTPPRAVQCLQRSIDRGLLAVGMLAMPRHLSLPAVLIAGAVLSAVGCQAGSGCFDYARPVADCQCNCCGCERCGSAHCGGCNSGGCATCNCSAQGDGMSSGPTMEEGTVSPGPVQQAPTPQAMPQTSGSMTHGAAYYQ